MGTREGFHGYGPEQGYDFLLEAIREHDYRARGVEIARDEIFVSDGSKRDSGNIQEIFGSDCRIAVTDPVYPVYVDTNVMAGRTGAADADGRYAGIVYLPATEANGFCPAPPAERVDLVYLCSPNNPTGAVATRAQPRGLGGLGARERRGDHLRRRLRRLHPGPRAAALDLRDRGRARVRDRDAQLLEARRLHRRALRLHRDAEGAARAAPRPASACRCSELWARRHATKFNGVPYPVQRAAAAVLLPRRAASRPASRSHYYMGNAALLREGLGAAGFSAVRRRARALHLDADSERPRHRGTASTSCSTRPTSSARPGAGFGAAGEGYFRISAFNSRENVDEAIARIRRAFGR